MKKISHFICKKSEPEKIEEGLKMRNIDADSIISIIEDRETIKIWYKTESKHLPPPPEPPKDRILREDGKGLVPPKNYRG